MTYLWNCILFLAAAISSDAASNDLLACFLMRADGKDTTGRSPPMHLTNAPFVEGVLYLNGVYEPFNAGAGGYGPGVVKGYHATASVPGLNYESFTISLDFFPLKTKQARHLRGLEMKLNEWTHGYYRRFFVERWGPPSNILTGGSWYRWLGFNPGTNGLEITLNNQVFRHQFNGSVVHLGEWHNLMCSLDLRRKEIVTILDGRPLEIVKLPENFRLEILGKDREVGDKELTFVNYSNGKIFNGYAAHLRVFSRALVISEMTNLYSDLTLERKGLPALTAFRKSYTWLPLLLIGGALIFVAVRSRRFLKAKPQAQ